jgi:hypothetical protein
VPADQAFCHKHENSTAYEDGTLLVAGNTTLQPKSFVRNLCRQPLHFPAALLISFSEPTILIR